MDPDDLMLDMSAGTITAICSYPLQESFTDYPDPHSNAVVVYMAGCDHRCKDCHNPELQNVQTIDLTSFCTYTALTLARAIIEAAHRFRTNKVVLLGGDPLAPMNRDMTRWLCTQLGAHYDVCIYTGYDASAVEAFSLTGFAYVKAGLYDTSAARRSGKNDRQMIFASSNQNIYGPQLKKLSKHGILTFKKVS